jgi:hypothetical protein
MQSYGKQYRPGYILTPIVTTTDKKSVLRQGREKFGMKRDAAIQKKGWLYECSVLLYSTMVRDDDIIIE